MMKKKQSLQTICLMALMLALVFGACQRKKLAHNVANEKYKYTDQFELKNIDSISFTLDSFNTSNTQCIRLNQNGKRTEFTFLNKKRGAIVFYDLNSGKYLKTLKIATGGPATVGPVIEGYQFIGKDSILIVSRYTISIIDTIGKILYRYDTGKNVKEDFTAIPLLTSDAPCYMDKKNNTLYMACVADKDPDRPDSFSDKSVLMKIDLTERSFTYLYSFPPIYQDKIYGVNYMMPSIVFGENNKLLASFAADNFLSYANLNDAELSEAYAGSKLVHKVKALSEPIRDFSDYTEYFVKNASYGGIRYNPVNNLYYRAAYLPRTNSDYLHQKFWKQATIVLLDKDLKKVGETDVLNEHLSFYQSFVHQNKFYIGYLNEDENHFKFMIYEPRRKT